MAIIAKQLDLGSSIEQLRQEFNNLQADVETIQINPTYGSALIFEGPTDDEFETTVQVQDPTSDNLIYIPNESGTLLITGAAINATTSSISLEVIIFFLFELGKRYCDAPASSKTSMALSGSFRSPIYLFESSTALIIASDEYFIL